jgi:hypothetical protein
MGRKPLLILTAEDLDTHVQRPGGPELEVPPT